MFIKELLAYDFEAGKDNGAAFDKQLSNIRAFAELDRTGLAFKKTERRLLLHETPAGEKIYIQYPGKESFSSDITKAKPWDFRPKAFDCNGNPIKDLSFADIWDDISEMNEKDEEAIHILAAVFFRMAYLINYEEVEEELEYEDIEADTLSVTSTGKVRINWFRPSFPNEVYDYLNEKIGLIRGISPEAYIFYNDLLAQNEDCKYYYRETKLKGIKWKGTPGRRNTMLSHLSVIEYLCHNIKFSEIMNRFQRGMGVAPIPNKSVTIITDGIIKR